ncbi:MAG: DUF6088 family protein [Oscillospiraceae bacterium]|jgi:hypothetical protein|nr:DUF6088 family protein [Oscillospiraceae bacterium]
MNSKGYSKKLDIRLSEMNPGVPFVANDFSDIANVCTIRKLLNIRTKKCIIARILPGIYMIPKKNKLLNVEVPVNPEELAQAIARNHNWNIAPSGMTALNMLGLSTQVPAVWKYISDGPYKTYEIDSIMIQFRRTTNKNISSMSPTSSLVVQAFKAIGKTDLSSEVLLKIASRLTKDDAITLMNDTTRTTSWIRDSIRELAGIVGETK